MRSGRRAAAITGVAGLSVLLGAGVAMAAASGTFNLSVSGANAKGTYQYGVRPATKAASRSSASINSVLYDPAARYVTHSQAQVCRDRTLLGQACSVGTYNY